MYDSIAAATSWASNEGFSVGVAVESAWFNSSISRAAASFAMRSSGVEVMSICIVSDAGAGGLYGGVTGKSGGDRRIALLF